jgi:hypothetical protein
MRLRQVFIAGLIGLALAVLVFFAPRTAVPLNVISLAATTPGPQVFLPLIMKNASSPGVPLTGTVVFPVGPGGADVVPRQVVRAANDRLYLFSAAQDSPLIRVYRSKVFDPRSASDFDAAVTATESEKPLSIDAVYDGGNIVFVLTNTNAGKLKVYPFDLAQNTFKPALTLTTGNPTVPSGLYVGTQGVSGLVDQNGLLHIAYWSAGNQIKHRAYTYDSAGNTLNPSGTETRVDTAGSANHPSLAVSPLDNSVTVAWVSEAANPVRILARTRSAAGSWGGVEIVSTAEAWHSIYFGINVDQGPALVIGANGVKHLAYIEHFDGTGDYGRVHYVAKAISGGWVDTALSFYSHAPALAINGAGALYIIGHGHPKNPAGPCQDMRDMCFLAKNGSGWGAAQRLIQHASGQSFDASPSVKWSVVGWNRPESIEFIFFGIPTTPSDDYTKPTLYYARFP